MIDHEGFYDVCEGCVLQLGGEFGMLPADEALQARKGTSEAFETIQKLEHELNEQRQSFDHITQQYANLTMEHKAALSIAEEASKSQSADRALIAELNRDNNLLRKQLPDSDV
ncbi:MAG: hypothetical protein OEM32_08600 [Acidimicrobiia bacterium]|nr:hypothetical protein [Acidimicrobiia bacterium]